MAVLEDVITGTCNWVVLGRSAYCARDSAGDQACVSWEGGWQSIQGCVAHAILASARGEFGQDQDLSCYFPKSLHNNDKRSEHKEQVCVSNRPDGC